MEARLLKGKKVTRFDVREFEEIASHVSDASLLRCYNRCMQVPRPFNINVIVVLFGFLLKNFSIDSPLFALAVLSSSNSAAEFNDVVKQLAKYHLTELINGNFFL